jgi:hypothetical protein
MRRVAAFVTCLLLVGLSVGPASAQSTSDQKQAAREKALEERAKRKEEQSIIAQSNKPTPLIHFHASRHPSPELSWLHQKKRKGYADSSLFLGK